MGWQPTSTAHNRIAVMNLSSINHLAGLEDVEQEPTWIIVVALVTVWQQL
jgi:hypothetical protein